MEPQAVTTTASQHLHLADLPNEILDRIFSLLPVPTTRLCRLISHRFLPSATRASFPILVVSPLSGDAFEVECFANAPDIAPTVKSIYYVTDTLAEPLWQRHERPSPSDTSQELIIPDELTWTPTDHPRNWLPHYVHHPEGTGRIDILPPASYNHRLRPLISHHRRSRHQIEQDVKRYENILVDQAQFAAHGDDGIITSFMHFTALEDITLAACRELSLAAPLNSVPLHSDRNPFRYAPWRTAFPSISTPETERRVLRSLVEYLQFQAVKGGRPRLKTLRIKNLSWGVLDDPGLFFSPMVDQSLANLTTLEIQIRHGNPIHVAASDCIPPMTQTMLSDIMRSCRVRRFLKHLTNLRHLTFERDRVWYRDDEMYPEGEQYKWSLGDIIDPEFCWPHLQSLSLSHLNDCDRQDIERIMDNHADTLWKVSLGDSNLMKTSWVNLVDYFYQANQRRIAGDEDRPLYHLELWGALNGTREKRIIASQQPDAPDHAGEEESWAFWRGETQSWELARYVYGVAFQVSSYSHEHTPLYARIADEHQQLPGW